MTASPSRSAAAGDPPRSPSRRPRITLIVARGPRGEIGLEGRLPWRLPADLAHFKRTTLGHPVIAGRRTFESIGRPLPGRRNLVLTRHPERLPAGVEGIATVGEALERCAGDEEVFVIGGGEVYRLFERVADRWLVTEVEGEFSADTFLPPLDPAHWVETSRIRHLPDARNPHPYSFVTWLRRENRSDGSARRP